MLRSAPGYDRSNEADTEAPDGLYSRGRSAMDDRGQDDEEAIRQGYPIYEIGPAPVR